MTGIEQFVPRERQFGAALTEVREPLIDILTERVDAGEDIIDVNAELSRPVLGVWGMSEALTGMCAPTPEGDVTKMQAAMYRGLCFGLQLSDDIRSTPNGRLTMQYLNDVQERAGERPPMELMASDVEDYLETRPEIHSLLFVFMSEIANGYAFHKHTEFAAGLMLMLSERGQAEHYIEREMSELALRLTVETGYTDTENKETE